MNTMRSLALAAGLLLAPAAAHAQRTYLGVALGAQSVPSAFDDCTNNGRTVVEARAGIARGLLALEARVAGAAELAGDICALELRAPIPQSGTTRAIVYPFDQGGAHVATDLRLRVGGTPGLPFTVSAGGGYTPTYGLPYLLAGVGVRTAGRTRFALEVERDWYHVRGDLVTTEWPADGPAREIARERNVAWLPGTGIRVGVELTVH